MSINKQIIRWKLEQKQAFIVLVHPGLRASIQAYTVLNIRAALRYGAPPHNSIIIVTQGTDLGAHKIHANTDQVADTQIGDMETRSKHRSTDLQPPIAFSETRQRAQNIPLFTARFTTNKPWINREETNLEKIQRLGWGKQTEEKTMKQKRRGEEYNYRGKECPWCWYFPCRRASLRHRRGERAREPHDVSATLWRGSNKWISARTSDDANIKKEQQQMKEVMKTKMMLPRIVVVMAMAIGLLVVTGILLSMFMVMFFHNQMTIRWRYKYRYYASPQLPSHSILDVLDYIYVLRINFPGQR